MSRPRIFCIGLNKTCTSSVHEALELLGFNSLHWGGPTVRRAVTRAAKSGRPMLADLDPTVDAVSDIAFIAYNFDLADRQYPGSKFILTVRDVDDWLDSRRRHVEKNQLKHAQGRYDGSFLTIDVDAWRADYESHVTRVRAYFHGRPDDLLELDIAAGDGWERLCPFLGVPMPDDPFPWQNRYQPWRTRA